MRSQGQLLIVSIVKSLVAQCCAQPLSQGIFVDKAYSKVPSFASGYKLKDDWMGGDSLASKRVGQSHKTMDIVKTKSRCFLDFG